MDENKTKKYAFVVFLTCEYDEKEDFQLFKTDLEQEIGCCWHGFNIESIRDISELVNPNKSDEGE